MLEKLRFVFDPCHPAWNFPQKFSQRGADNRGDVQMATAQQPMHQRRHVDMKQISRASMVQGGPNFSCRLPIRSHFSRFNDKADTTHQISCKSQTECAINVVSASHNLCQICCDKIVSDVAERWGHAT
jgi:hypothetical protein